MSLTRGVLLGAVLCCFATHLCAQEPVYVERFRRRGEATSRYETWRGRARLPEVDLSLDKPAEGVEEEEPLFLENVAKWMRVHGGIGVQEKYTSNVFLQPGGVIRNGSTPSDFVTMISPSVRLELPSKKMPIKVDYFADIIRTGHYENFNADEHHIAAAGELKLAPRFSLAVSNDFARMGVEPRNPDANLTYYNTNTFSGSGIYRFGKRGSVEVGWRHALSRFDLLAYRTSEYDIDTLFINGYYALQPRFGLLAKYHHEWVDNKRFIVDDERDRIAGGVRWDITSRLNGTAMLGYEVMKFTSDCNKGTLYAHAELVYDWAKNLRLGLYLDRSLRETTLIAENKAYGDGFTTTQLTLNAIYKLTRTVSITQGFFVIVDQYSTPPYAVQQFLLQNSFDSRARRDDLFGTTLGLQWQPTRYMRFGATYEHQENTSNIRSPHVDFEESSFLLNASLGF